MHKPLMNFARFAHGVTEFLPDLDFTYIYVFFAWIFRTSSVVSPCFICDTSVKIARIDPNISHFFHVYPHMTKFYLWNMHKLYAVAVWHSLNLL